MTNATNAAAKPTNYTAAQEQIIRDHFASVNRPLNFDDCTALAARSDMRDEDGNERKPRSIAAKITRMDDVEYARKVPTTKSGDPVSKKSDIVAVIAKSAGVAVEKLDGLDKAPKLALVTLRDVLAAQAA